MENAYHSPRHPRLPYALHLAFGAAMGALSAPLLSAPIACAVLVLGSAATVWACVRLVSSPHRQALLWLIAGLGLGVVRATSALPAFRAGDSVVDHLAEWPQRLPVRVRGCLASGPRRTRTGWQAVIELEQLRARGSSFVPVSGRLRMIWRGDGLLPVTGDCLEVSGDAMASDRSLQPYGWSSSEADARAGVSGRLLVVDTVGRGLPGDAILLPPSPRPWLRLVATVDRHRLRMERAVLDAGPHRGASWVMAVGAGTRSGLDESDRDMMTRAGIAHLLAVSGLHLALFVLSLRRVLEWLFSRSVTLLGLVDRRIFGAAAVIPLAWLYVMFTGFGTAAVRAAIFVTCLGAAELVGRRASLAGAVGLATTIIVMSNPAEIRGPSFQLSIAAVAGIAIATRTYGRRQLADPGTVPRRLARRWGSRLAVLARASVGASLATAPVLAYHFGAVSVSGLVANIVVAPILAMALVPASGLALALAPTELPLAEQICRFAERAVDAGFAVLAPLTRVLGDPWVTGRPTSLELLLYASALLGVVAALRPGRRRRRALRLGFLSAAVCAALAFGRLWPPATLEIWFLPVGQGDSTLVRSPTGHTILIDTGGRAGGSDPGRTIVVPILRGLGVREIDLLVITHEDIDHAGGMRAVLEAFPVRELWWGGPARDLVEGDRFGGHLDSSTHLRVVRESPLRRFQMGPVEIAILHPAPRMLDTFPMALESNEGSICLLLTYMNRRVLFPADVQVEGETLLVNHFGNRLRADVLKAPHHGSRTSSSMALLTRVLPSHAVFSVGPGNPYGFPHDDVADRYDRLHIRTYRTDRDGLVRFRLSRRGIEVRAFGGD